METMSFQAFRVGSLEKPAVYGRPRLMPDGRELTLFQFADERRPDGHTGRLEGLFCCPTLGELAAWRGGPRGSWDNSWQLDCLGAEPFVYDAECWSRIEDEWVFLHDGDPCYPPSVGASVERVAGWVDRYWTTGVPLSRWHSGPRPAWWNGEMLVPPAAIVGVSPAAAALAA